MSELFIELFDANEYREKCMTESDSVLVWFYGSQEDLDVPEVETLAKRFGGIELYKMNALNIPEIGDSNEILPYFRSSDSPEIPAFPFIKGRERVHLVRGRNQSSASDGFMLLMAYR